MRNTIRTKTDVERSYHQGHHGRPMLCVKDDFYYGPMLQQIQDAHQCDERTAERALEYATDAARERFWEDMEESARDVFGPSVKVWQAGRCGGWLIVDGLPDVDTWDARALAKWRKFARIIEQDMTYRRDSLMEDIEANRWAEPYAERYNFVDKPDGTFACLADINKATAEFRAGLLGKRED